MRERLSSNGNCVISGNERPWEVVILEWLFRTDCSVSIPPDAEKFSALAERLEIRGDRIELVPTFVDAIEPRIRNIADVNYKVEFFAFSSVDGPFQ